ncbi:MAG: hypothetical protein GF383_11255 [Candidatus Lokiarchaeota archaeon]|nr:hypothetical protein [Candidatus Lokiarchaeota archaeon]MBD3341292.1 hypothetical protein [Candidatus Lokiarchaeota archaeon]
MIVSKKRLKELLKKKGLKITPQRTAVYEAVMNSHNHPSAEEIYAKVSKRFENISLSTVYQILHLLEDLGEIAQIEIDGIQRYENQTKFHIHAICPRCKKVDDLYSESIKEFWYLISEEFNFEPINQEIKITRYCQDCIKEMENH